MTGKEFESRFHQLDASVEKPEAGRGITKIYIIYRDNESCRNYLPVVEETFRSLGIAVEKLVFKPGPVNAEEAASSICALPINPKSEQILIDGTMKGFLTGDQRNTVYSNSLDTLFSEAVGKVLLDPREWRNDFPVDFYSHREDRDFYGRAFKALFESIVKKSGSPTAVFLVQDFLGNHEPFGFRRNELGDSVEIISKWLESAGINPSLIRLVRNKIEYYEMREEDLQDVGQPGQWVIIDRHKLSHINSGVFGESKILVLPIDEMLLSAVKQNLAGVDPAAMGQAIKEIVTERFGGAQGKDKSLEPGGEPGENEI